MGDMRRRLRRHKRLPSNSKGRNQMTADDAVCAGECHRRQSESTRDRDGAKAALRPHGVAVVRALDWPAHRFADTCAIIDGDEPDGARILAEMPRVPGLALVGVTP